MLQKALDGREDKRLPAIENARTRFALARALDSLQTPKARTAQLARQAFDDYEQSPPFAAAEQKQVETWLAARGRL
jgi:hypothetical protein